MATGSEPAWLAKFLESVKELPAWALTAIAVALWTYLLVPKFDVGLPSSQRTWLVLAAVVFSSLAVARWISLAWQFATSRAENANARRTFRLTPIDTSCFWSTSKQADDSYITQLSADFHVKNRTSGDLGPFSIRIVSSIFNLFSTRGKYVQKMLTPFRGGTRILVGETEDMRACIILQGRPGKNPGEDLKIIFAISDDDGNEQRIKLTLPSWDKPQKTNPVIKLEVPSRIADQTEKSVASILQSELTRYDNCGRRAGGLGSVYLVANGQPMRGIGGDSWTPNIPRNQIIRESPDEVALFSDNLDSMLALYASLSSDEKRSDFSNSLYRRFNPDKGYLRISYFLFLTLWKTGLFGDALDAAKSSLPQGETKDFGLSNILMLLNGTLRQQHELFTGEMLDQIEEFMDGLNEHKFLVAQKIVAIRAMRLRKN